MANGRLPQAVNDARCDRCQFRDHCLPEVSARPQAILDYLREVVGCAC